MSFWKRFLGSSSGLPDDAAVFADRLVRHLDRIKGAGEAYNAFVVKYFSAEVVSTLAASTAGEMALTQKDRTEHSFAISSPPVCYQVCTLIGSVSEAKSYFTQRYGGYSKLLEYSWNSSHFREAGCEILAHIVYARTKRDAWINMAIFPVNSQIFRFKPILPLDLLTQSEGKAPDFHKRFSTAGQEGAAQVLKDTQTRSGDSDTGSGGAEAQRAGSDERPDAQVRLARSHEANGNVAEALRCFRAALNSSFADRAAQGNAMDEVRRLLRGAFCPRCNAPVATYYEFETNNDRCKSCKTPVVFRTPGSVRDHTARKAVDRPARSVPDDARRLMGKDLYDAAIGGNLAAVKHLIAAGADVNAKDISGCTALMQASAAGHAEIVRSLLAAKANVNASTCKGTTALIFASVKGKAETVTSLLAAGADVNAKDNEGCTALDLASQIGHADVVASLLAAGADVNAKDNEGFTALDLASHKGHADVVACLLAAKADVNARDNDGTTALMVASLEGHGEIVTTLLAAGADVTTKTNGGLTALDFARRNGHGEVVKVLEAAGAK